MGGDLESSCVGRVYGADGAVSLYFTLKYISINIRISLCVEKTLVLQWYTHTRLKPVALEHVRLVTSKYVR